jgi:hypothetical protein
MVASAASRTVTRCRTDGSMGPVPTTRRGTVPNQEWVLMYRGGLTRGQIADRVGAPAKPSRFTSQGLARMQELVAVVQETGRYPSGTPRAPRNGLWRCGCSAAPA